MVRNIFWTFYKCPKMKSRTSKIGEKCDSQHDALKRDCKRIFMTA
jgi:hypothetical protein